MGSPRNLSVVSFMLSASSELNAAKVGDVAIAEKTVEAVRLRVITVHVRLDLDKKQHRIPIHEIKFEVTNPFHVRNSSTY